MNILATTTNNDAVAGAAGVAGLAMMAIVIIAIVWTLFPFIV